MNRESYLEVMGVTRWRLRTEKAPLPSAQIYRLTSEKGVMEGILVAELSNDAPARDAELALLSGIVNALRMTSVEAPPSENSALNCLIILGKDIARHYGPMQAARRVVTHSLKKMLENPSLKAEVWKELKQSILPHL